MTTGQMKIAYADEHRREGTAQAEITILADGRRVCTVWQTSDDTGPSVTNSAEHIAAALIARLKIDPRQLVYIEHYPAGDAHGPVPDWDLVTFALTPAGKITYPQWRAARRGDFGELGLPDPRPFALEVDAIGEGDEAATLYRIYDNLAGEPRRQSPRATDTSPRLLGWWCDRPELHGQEACGRAMRRLSALYRGKVKPEPLGFSVGDTVCILKPFGHGFVSAKASIMEIDPDNAAAPYRVEVQTGDCKTRMHLARSEMAEP